MISTAEYLSVINEVYDLSDDDLRKQLIFCNEAQKLSNVEHILNNLYNHIISNTTEVDFGTIPKSKGNITKIENFQQLIDCIDSIHKLILEDKDDTIIVDQISTAINNLQQRQRVFEKAFVMNIEFPVFIYNYTALSVVSCTSLLISTCIEYVKNGHGSFDESFDKTSYVKTKDHVLYKGIVSFNQMCQDKSLDKIMDACIKNNAVAESTILTEKNEIGRVARGAASLGVKLGYLGTLASKTASGKNVASNIIAAASKFGTFGKIITGITIVISALIVLLMTIKQGLYYYKWGRMKFSDWLDVQANYLQINAENLKYREDRKGSDEHKEKVYNRQMKWVERFKKWSNFFMLKDKKAQKDAKDEDEQDRKRKPNSDQNDTDDGGLF